MAEQQQDSNEASQPKRGESSGSSKTTTNTFHKGMMKDYNELFIGEGLYTHARNIVNNSHDGQVGVIGNEPSTLSCIKLPYTGATIIGATHTIDDLWVIFSTNDVASEIGLFDESQCSYKTLVNDPCLGFKKTNLITATNRPKYNCGTLVYWDDGLNPTRSMDIEDIPWIQTCTTVNGCTTCVDTNRLNCEKIRIAPYIKHPCITIERGVTAGTLPNGSYQACIAYTLNQLKISDYVGLSEVQGLFTQDNVSSSLIITINDIDTTFDEFELVLLTNINAQTVAKRIGFYNTSQGTIYVDRWDPEYVTVPVSSIVQRSEPIEKSDALYSVGDYLIRTGVYNKFRFNYQPLANQIRVKWVCTEYPEDYYIKSNNNAGYLRDEQYAFFIRFAYNTGEFSDSYHIPGRPPIASDLVNVSGGDAFESTPMQYWQVQNTASITTPAGFSVNTLDGGTIIGKGDMAYWESTERYPSDKPDIWNSFPNNPGSPLNLCGKNIRHHKMPDETVPGMFSLFNTGGTRIRLLGVDFENIKCPVDDLGVPIASIVGYEILRSSREGNKTILAKGLINNMRTYDIPGTSVKGLYQNYPYNDLSDDKFLTSTFQGSISGGVNPDPPLSGYSDKIFSFHSPDISFSNPFLNPYDLKVYTTYSGDSSGKFVRPYRHPKHKFLSNFAVALINAIASAVAAKRLLAASDRSENQEDFDFNLAANNNINVNQSIFSKHKDDTLYGHQKPLEIKGNAINGTPVTGVVTVPPAVVTITGGGISGGDISTPQTGEAWWNQIGGVDANEADNADRAAVAVRARVEKNKEISNKNSDIFLISAGYTTVLMAQTMQEQLYSLVINLIPFVQYSLQYDSYGFYNNSIVNPINNRRRKINDAYYVGPTIQQYNQLYQVNNLHRSRIVVFDIDNSINPPLVTDNSRVLKSEVASDIDQLFSKKISGQYAAMKIAMPSQYGQLDMIKQIPISTCIFPINPLAPLGTVYSTSTTNNPGPLWGGDIYVNRFTEKNSMFFFNNWLMGEPDGTDIDYTNYHNIPYARFWINSTNTNGSLWRNASRYRSLDDISSTAIFYVNRGYFYLFNSGVRDFFVESEVNVAYRDWEEEIPKRHYDPYRFTDLSAMFRSDVIKSGNYYKYDYSLSISKLVGSQFTWGTILPRDYDPEITKSCYTYTPNRVIYSLPLKDETPRQDSWAIFRTNNKKDFITPVSSIKSINKTGAVFMMKNRSPLSFMGVEELKLDGSGAKITIGDGKLFETGQNQLQALVNTEQSYEYGSNQSNYSAINTTYGLFWVSQAAGKVFSYGGSGLEEISKNGMRWWFFKYLPSELLKVFPDYALYDNAVVGIGTQIMYDSTYEIIYVTKKDYKPKYPVGNGLNQIALSPIDLTTFTFNGTPIQLTDSRYFEDASWTMSYDPKVKAWLSFHDWKPTFMLPGRNRFMSVAKSVGSTQDTIWKHNIRCDSYCNFYGVDHPFEIEFLSATAQTVTSMRSIEYMLEVYTFHNDCRDRFHVLDQNFDQAVIYNSEQISGVLQLVLKTKNNPLSMLSYPQINANSISIQFSKEENKYRFNQFWDITKNRGEFPPGFNLPMFTTASNGYEYPINPSYVDYNKPILERKKFRHYFNNVFLRRVNSGSYKFLFKISNQKLLQSPR
jgi:hypothetical protein